ncbi:MAG: prolipoprotein diacylglyceryl transferase [Actinomycetia bacterium]|nr:prolipoprotein diacylglyceryl transferase [Actinomycetes bacterium]
MEFSLLGSAAIGVFGFWIMLRWEAKRGNAAGCAVDLWDAGLVAATSGLFIGRIVAMIQDGINPLTNPLQIILIRSGVSTVAVVAGTLTVFAYVARRSLVDAADGIAPAALMGLAGWHAGCLATGSCLGTESSLAWASPLPGSDITRHPVEIYAAIALGVASIALALWKQYGRPPLGSITGAAILSAAGIRLATEPMRISLAGGPVLLYGAGVVIGIGLIVASLVGKSRQ